MPYTRTSVWSLETNNLFSLLHVVAFWLLFSSCTITGVSATPIHILETRQIINTINGDITIFDENTKQRVAQGRATDGGGDGFSIPAILWIIFCGVIGPPLALAGVRGWRLTSGFGLGLASSILIWAAFVNTMTPEGLNPDPNISDLLLDIIVWSAFLIGVGLGFLKLGTAAGVCMLGACGGVAVAIMIVLLRPGLLFPEHFVNIIPLGLFACGGFGLTLFRQKIGVIFGSTSSGSFLIALGVDLIINKQSGMSKGLRFLLDRNDTHLAELLTTGYKPPISTFVLLGIGMGMIPILSYGQWRFFKEPFDRSPRSLEEYRIAVNGTPIVGPKDDDLDSTEKSFAPYHLQGSVFRASAAFLSWKPAKQKSRFSHV